MTTPPPLTIEQALSRAKAQLKRGNRQAAHELYTLVLSHDPRNKKAKKELKALEQRITNGNRAALSREQYQQLITLLSSGRAAEAATEADRLARSHPGDPFIHNLSAAAHASLGQPALAAAGYRRALELKPDYAEAWNNLGNALDDLGEGREALECYHRALAIQPAYADAHYNLGASHHALGELEPAVEHYRRALALQPGYAKAHNNLANALREQGHLDEALAGYLRALEFQPDDAATHSNLGVVLCGLGRFDEAVERFQRALSFDPRLANAHANLGDALRKLGRQPEAEACCLRAIEIQPDSAEAYNNLGNAQSDMGRLDQAIESYERAVALRPDYPDAHANLSLCLLLRGEYQRGWREYEWRLKKEGDDLIQPDHLPRWNGEFDFGDELILIHEQGLGDTLQFLRYGIALKERLPTVSLAVPDKLIGIVEQAEIFDRVYPLPLRAGSHSPGARWAPLLSVPGALGVTLDRPRVSSPYLRSDPVRDAAWGARLKPADERLIAINWQGNPNSERLNLKGRSLPLAALAPVAELPGIRLVSLQKGFGAEQLPDCPFRDRFVDCQEAVDEAWDFRDNAAILMNCDLLISSDTAVVHLAGALGVPTWVLLHPTPDWRWARDREDSPWYPSARLFRQRKAGDWAEVIGRVAERLKRRIDPGETP